MGAAFHHTSHQLHTVLSRHLILVKQPNLKKNSFLLPEFLLINIWQKFLSLFGFVWCVFFFFDHVFLCLVCFLTNQLFSRCWAPMSLTCCLYSIPNFSWIICQIQVLPWVCNRTIWPPTYSKQEWSSNPKEADNVKKGLTKWLDGKMEISVEFH